MLFSQSVSSASMRRVSAFRFTCRLPASLRLSLLAACFLGACLWSGLWLASQQVQIGAVSYRGNLVSVRFAALNRAAALFPLDFTNRRLAADAAVALQAVLAKETVLSMVDAALRNDPHDPSLLRARATLTGDAKEYSNGR